MIFMIMIIIIMKKKEYLGGLASRRRIGEVQLNHFRSEDGAGVLDAEGDVQCAGDLFNK